MSRPRLGILAALASVALTTLSLAAPQAHAAVYQDTCPRFFVSPYGSDNGPGTIGHPWRTIQHARDHIRAHRLNLPRRMGCDITVNLLAGVYRIGQPVTFTDQDSGTGGHHIIYRSYDGPGKAVLLGSRRVAGWRPWSGDVYRAHVGTGQGIYTLYANGQRVTEARYPTRTATRSGAPYLTTTSLTGSNTQFTYAPGDVDPAWNLTGAQAVVWSGGPWSWFTDTVPVASVDKATRTITLAEQTRFPMYQYGHGSRYYLQNSLSFLTAPDEYYYDPGSGYLYFWPPGGSIRDQDVEVPVVSTILSVAGSSTSARAHDLVFDGLALRYTNFTDWYRYGWVTANGSGEGHKYPGYDRQIEMTRNRYGAITLTNSHDVVLTKMNIAETGFHAVYLLFANDGDVVSGSEISHTGANGIKVEGPYPGEGDLATHNTFTDNYVHHVGETVEGDAAAIKLMDASDTVVSHSVFEYSPRYAVGWAVFPGIATADDYGFGEQLSYLRIAHVGTDSGDMGAIYAYETDNQPSSVSQVTINDVNADPSMPDVPPSGINMDFGTCTISFSDVQVTNAEKKQFNAGKGLTCYPFDNVSWSGTFDPARMRYSRIGVTRDFPYPVPRS